MKKDLCMKSISAVQNIFFIVSYSRLRVLDWSNLKGRALFISKTNSEHWLFGHNANFGSNDVRGIKSISAGFYSAASLRYNPGVYVAADEAKTSCALSNAYLRYIMILKLPVAWMVILSPSWRYWCWHNITNSHNKKIHNFVIKKNTVC